jgi:hypothetical protein
MTTELTALYHLHRYQIILNMKNSNGIYQLPVAYLYSVANNIFPYFHTNWCCDDNDPYQDCYTINKDFVTEVIEYMDDLWIHSKPIPTFYDLESKYTKEYRCELVAILRYCYLHQGFDENFYKAIIERSPCEANICMKFSDDELLLL